MKKETLKQKQARFNKLFKDIMKQLKDNGATFIAIPDPTTKNMRVIMVEQQEADEYFKLVDDQVKNQINEQIESIGDPISSKQHGAEKQKRANSGKTKEK